MSGHFLVGRHCVMAVLRIVMLLSHYWFIIRSVFPCVHGFLKFNLTQIQVFNCLYVGYNMVILKWLRM